jgi:3'-phosphoadenosine 5'-phosphosulfate sulfotransferase (PAPS reductase)/FAD synthetase
MELVINFSGGKDSCAMLAYLMDKYPEVTKHVVFADTGWEHTDAETWSRKIVEGYGLPLHVVRNPNKTFLEMVERRRIFPGMQTRQCTSDLKVGPINTWIRRNIKDPVVVSCVGIRSEESSGRKKAAKLKRDKSETNSKRTIWLWSPIKDWSEQQVLAYLSEKNIPLHPVYQYLRRFSCRVCIYMSRHDLQAVAIHDPEAVKIIAGIEERIGFTMFQSGPIYSLITTEK